MSTGLHTQLDEAIRARLELARAVIAFGPYEATLGVHSKALSDALTALIVANSPATVIRLCQRDLRVLERHAELPDSWGSCAWCLGADPRGPALVDYPCIEVRDLAVAYGLLDPAGE